MRKFTIKSLLITAALCLGTSAWAEETTTTYNFEDGNAVFTGDSRISVGIENDATLNSNVVAFTCANNAQNGYSFAHYDFTKLIVDGTTQVTINFDYYNTDGGRAIVSIGDAATRGTTGGSSKTTYNGAGALFRLGSDKNYAILNGSGNLPKGTYCNIWMNVNVVVDLLNKQISYVIKKKTDDSVISEGTNVAYYNDAASCTQIDLFGYINNSKCALIDNLSITSFVDESIKKKDYTINYIFNNEIIKTVEGNMGVGFVIETESVITVGEDKYLSVEDAQQLTITADGTNTWDVEVRKPYTAKLSVTTTIGDETLEPVVTPLTESDEKVCSWSYSYPLYIKNGDVYYIADNTETFGEVGTFTNDQIIEKSISYTNVAEDVVFFAESQTETMGSNPAYSNGAKGNVAAQNARDRGIAVGKLPIGTYEFIVNIAAANRRSVVARIGNADPFAAVGTSNSDMTTGLKSATFTLTEETSNIIINGANSGTNKTNQSEEFDYVIIKRTGDATVSTTITAAGYATFSSAYAVDFSAAEGLTAYTATVSENKVVMTPIENGIVPANTGVILKGAAGNYTGVITTTEAVIENNDLVAATKEIASLATETTVDEVTYKNYILNVVDETPGFYQAAGKKVAAGKAYLQVLAATVAEAKALTIVWNDGETTGIEENYEFGTMNSDAATFDLSGRKVANPAKGLYIKNGKKFIIK